MSRVFVDTSAWYAFLRADDPDHAACRTALTAHRTGRITSNYVFDEVVTLVRLRTNHSTAVKAGETLRGAVDLEVVRVQPADEDEAWGLFTKHRDKHYSFTDCTSFALMRRLGVDIALATDRHFIQAGFRVEP